ncbi:MAG: hypothetical protein U1F37_16530 [Alphaproteobacteria bacterium]
MTGGDPPYSAEWIQQAPPESIVIEKVEHSPGGVQARVVVRVKSAQGDGNYVLRINDRTGLGRSILVTVGRGTPAPAAPPASRNGPAPASSPEVVSIQDLLHKAGCLKDPKSVQSGVYDAKTQAAVAALMKATDKTDEDRAGRYGTAVPKDVKPATLIEVLSPQRLTQMNGKCDPLT